MASIGPQHFPQMVDHSMENQQMKVKNINMLDKEYWTELLYVG
jgi:hypothetical protein